MTLGLPKSHFFLKLSQNEKASEASERGVENKASLGSITSTPAFRKKNWKRSKNFFDFLRKKGVDDHDEISFP